MDRRGFVILGLTAVFTLVIGDESTKGTCPANMHYMECGTSCPETCTEVTGQHHSPRACALPCVSGCFCNDGYIYENTTSKHCIPYSDCKQTCQANSEHVKCGTACPLTCENYRNPPIICTFQCVPGCACKPGYILESATSKNCIRPSDCKMACQDHASYSECGTACPLTCDNYDSPTVCTRECAVGCFCNKGYVLENATSNRCIPRSDCKKSCGSNSSYQACGTDCPLTCDNYDNPLQMCTEQCVVGCFCDEGYVFESATCKRCMPQSDCKNTCKGNSNYTDCGTACPLTCDNYDNPPLVCSKQCVPGCSCNKGFVLESAASKCCIPLSECKKACPENAQYTDCGTACPLTCDNYDNPPLVCSKECVQGCFCKEGFVFENAVSKRCIPQSECKKACGLHSRYTNCGTACPLTCDNYDNPPQVCTYQCVAGCFCEEGYVFKSATSKRCIPPTVCKRACPDHSKYTECGSACPLSCDNYENPLRACTDQCVPGCFCEEGYVLEKDGSSRCVKQSSCKTRCSANSHYQQCGTACPKTCADVTNPVPRPCTLQCSAGCFCDVGYVLENAASTFCVKESLCKSCEANSHYSTCATACPLNCRNYRHPPQICPLICLEGCICNKGHVFKSGQSGPCVPVSDCSDITED